jgi:signal transduction histidine kinase
MSFVWAADRVALEISDNGVGFDLDRVAADGHLGLLGMRERARELDGTLVLDTGPGCGACLRLGVPVASAVLNADTNKYDYPGIHIDGGLS